MVSFVIVMTKVIKKSLAALSFDGNRVEAYWDPQAYFDVSKKKFTFSAFLNWHAFRTELLEGPLPI
jgi:hypothetical protein